MKKFLLTLVLLCMTVCFTACGHKQEANNPPVNNSVTEEVQQAVTQEPSMTDTQEEVIEIPDDSTKTSK